MISSPAGSSWLRSWPVLLILFFVPAAAWAVANPIFSVPDEPADAAKAVSIWYGELNGRTTQQGSGLRTFRIPLVWTLHNPCFAGHADVTADRCASVPQPARGVGDVATPAGSYPPLYYVLVGWGGRLFPRALGVYLMRLASAAACAVFLAWAVRALQTVIRPGLAAVGVLAAATPMLYFLAGSVNPNGFEIATAIALWAHVLAVARRVETRVESRVDKTEAGIEVTDGAIEALRRAAPIPRSLLVGLFVSGTALALTRPLSPVFVGLIVVLGLLSTGWPTLVAMARDRSVQITVGALAVAAVLAIVWVYVTGLVTGNILGGTPFPPAVDHWTYLLGNTSTYLGQMLGSFGWLDVPVSNLTLMAWLGAVFALIAGSVMLSRLRQNLSLLLTVTAVVVIPIALQSPAAGSNTLVWQGRYTLPIAVGIPLLAVLGIDRGAGAVAGLTRRLTAVVAVVVAVVNVHALWWNLHRYTVGLTNQGINILDARWQPPGGSLLWLLVMAAYGVAAVAVVTTAPDT